MVLISSDHNQRLGYSRYQKTGPFRQEYRHSSVQRTQLQEVRIADAKAQLLATGKIKKVLSVIGGGKEATVLLAENHNGQLSCGKVFRYFTSTIKKRIRGTKHVLPNDMACLAAKQEFWNLSEMVKHVPAPKPHFLNDNIIVMEFIPEKRGSYNPAPLLKDYDLRTFGDPGDFLDEAIDILARLFINGKYIHGDYSEHNLMVNSEGKLVTMDVSQSVQYNSKTFVETPIRIRIDSAVRFLRADLINITRFFRRNYRLRVDVEEIITNIVGYLPNHLRGFLKDRTMDIYPCELFSESMYIGKEGFRDDLVHERTGSKRQRPKFH
ncbi:MAG: RIO1 family regulatory kinase/ATPase [Candidatus Heimdallarchaeota archaeon]